MMTFGQKLKALLKEKDMTQENLAELLDVSRQAVGKWANDKGIPEVDKLVQISNIFGVSLDYLLKEGQEEEREGTSTGYYVSREMIEGFLSYKQQSAGRIAAGVALITLSDLVDCFLSPGRISMLLYNAVFLSGIAVLIWNGLKPRKYREIGSRQLLFDEGVIREFREKSERNRRKYAVMFIAGTALMLFGPELADLVSNRFGRWMGNAADQIFLASWSGLFILAGMNLYAENMLLRGTPKTRRGGKYTWLYGAIPVTALLVLIGYVTNAWRPAMPILVLFCVLLVTVCKLIVEGRNKIEN